MKVSVFIVTYNQEQYIEDCLNSILHQQTNFDYEVVIGEDCSTDKTLEICKKYAKKCNNIRLLPSQTNLGHVKSWERVLNACKGKYIAMCEGDDYWIDEHKLQKQVDFLDNHPDYSLTFHKVKLVYNDNVKKESLFSHLREKEYSAKEVYDTWSVLTSSVVFRNCLGTILFPKQIFYTDIYLVLLLLEKGKGYCLNITGVAYRRHKNSISKCSSIELNQKLFYQYKYMGKRFPLLKEISKRKKKEYLGWLIYAPFFNGIWKFRFIKMFEEPKLFFSTFFTTTLTSYIIKRKR